VQKGSLFQVRDGLNAARSKHYNHNTEELHKNPQNYKTMEEHIRCNHCLFVPGLGKFKTNPILELVKDFFVVYKYLNSF
jgi:hypothetical protein